MILRIAKAAAIGVTWSLFLPWFGQQLPDIVLQHWRSGRKQWAILEALSLSLQTLFYITTVSNVWRLGERQNNSVKFLEFQHKKLLKYCGVSLLFVLLLSVLLSPLPPKHNEQTAKLSIAVSVLLVVAPTLLRPLDETDKKTVYGLQHGRLHLNAHVPMWMNMGFWAVSVLYSIAGEAADPSKAPQRCALNIQELS